MDSESVAIKSPEVSSATTEADTHLKQHPRSLKRGAFACLLDVCSDVFAILAWSGMLMYAIVLWYFNGTFVKDMPFSAQKLLTVARPLSTLFSIIFAATFARLLRSLALWLLERGGKVGLLDQLVGSSSVSGALMAQISAGSRRALGMHITGTGLVVLWLLSPLGSQAVLRMSSIVPDTTSTNQTLPYLNVSNWNNLPGDSSDALISPIASKNAVQDLWSHVKVPLLSRMPTNSTDPDGWHQVSTSNVDDFSSLVGIPVGYLPASSNQSTTLALQSWYWNLECDSWKSGDPFGLEAPTPFSFNRNSTEGGRSTGYTWPAVKVYYNDNPVGNRATNACNVSSTSENSIIDCPELGARTLGFLLPQEFSDPYYTTCQITTEYVETEVSCSGITCTPKRIRQSQAFHLLNNWTVLDVWSGTSIPGYTVPSLFFNSFANSIAGRQGGSGGSNALTGYITNPSDPFSGNSPGSINAPSLQNVTDSLITARFTQVLNTYWITSIGSQLITGTDATFDNANQLNLQFISSSINGTTNMTGTTLATIDTPRYKLHCSIEWLVAFTIVTLIALVSAILGLVLVSMSRGPRLAMNISTILRDNQYSRAVQGGSYLDDSERSRLLHDLTVRIGDVAPGESVGHIAVSTVDAAGCAIVVGQLTKERLYD